MFISCVVPCLNEERNIASIAERIKTVFEKEKWDYEIIFVDDGSMDNTWGILKDLSKTDKKIKALRLTRNSGQHAAIMAGLTASKGEYTVTIDADLQNPPEEIVKLVEKAGDGYDVVGGWRYPRKDPILRKFLSLMMNRVISKSLGIKANDYGCMLRLYKRDVVDRMIHSHESTTYVPALGVIFGSNVTEVKIKHSSRENTASRYNIFKLIRLNYDLMTGFSLLPIQILSFIGFGVASLGLIFSAYLLIRSFIVKTMSGLEAVYAMFAVLFFFIGVIILAVGIIGEYVGRIFMSVRNRPAFIVKESLGIDKKS